MKPKTLMWLAICFVFPAIVMAQDNKEALVQELYRKSGLENQVVQIPALMQLGFDQASAADDQLGAMPRSVQLQIREAFKYAYAPDTIKATITAECREGLSASDVKKVLAWLNSALGQQCTRLEEAATDPKKYQEIQKFASQLSASPPSQDRIKIIQQLDAAVKATDTSVEVAMNMQLAVAIAIVASMPVEQQPARDQLTASIEQSRPQLEYALRNQTLVSMLYTYQSLTDQELNRYIAFASSPSGTNYHTVVSAGMQKALLQGGYKLGESIAEILNESASKSDT